MAAVASNITLKLLIDTRSNKVLFGEAGKDFVDFMFSLLTFPLGSVIKLLSPQSMVGSIGKLYESVENLKETYFVANSDKSSLLQPKVSIFNGANLLRLGSAEATVNPKYYQCYYCKVYVTTNKNTVCPSCKVAMASEVSFVAPPTSDSSSGGAGYGGKRVGGFVQGVMTYMITDDLEVTPMSAISSITLINRFNVNKDVQLKEAVVVVGMNEGLALLKASLDSATALSDVFCSSTKKP